ncbi:MAG: type II toxin-antitoxin system YafQ family toxin [Candidatus Magasanikbacteria bacterium]|nr:type II toxin-antitoxin system YafQ family toxin [Candidatus Magasanikbacteria bacterium]
MRYNLTSTKDFRRQYKKLKRSGNGRALEELKDVIYKLRSGEILSEKYRNHVLKGEYQGCFECHVLSDWLLVYQINENILVLELVATGTHSELF